MPDSPTVNEEFTAVQDCDHCGVLVPEGDLFHNDRLGLAVCEDCDNDHPPVFTCEHCGEEHEDENSAYDCCRFECQGCGYEYRSEDEAYECCLPQCENCGSRYDYQEEADECCRPSGRDYPSLPPLVAYTISVPEIEGRPARRCSVEQEVIKGGPEAARMLYDFGYADADGIQGYSHSPNPGRVAVCDDASLPGSGGEVKYSRFNLANDADIRSFSEAAGRMRQLAREARVVRVGKEAGTHIHIDVTDVNGKRIGPVEMTALHELFCYAEDAIYGIAAAGWDNGHRQSPTGRGGFCQPVPKIDQANAWRINRAMRSERYFGLNFGRLLSSAANCHCGAAQFGAWEDCECGVFDTATVEWRVFNASTKPETLHAWLLLSHAMTAHAFRHPIGTLPVNAYGVGTPAERWEVLGYLLEVLPLTEAEAQVIHEAACNSPYFKR